LNPSQGADWPALGYLVPEFPSQTHAFFWREIQAMRSLGGRVVVISTKRPPEGACRHDFAYAAASETIYLAPHGIVAALGFLALRPGRTLRALLHVLGLSETRFPRRLLLLALVPAAARLAIVARRQGLQHVHIHSCANAAHIGALTRVLADLPFSLTLHGDLPVYGTDHRAKMRTASFVACVTRPLQAQVLAEAGLSPERVPVIWMGVDVDRFRDQDARRPEAGVLKAVTIARLNWPKGHEFALRAIHALKREGIRIRYSIAGEGPYRPEIEALVIELALQEDVEFLGTVSENDVAQLLAAADVLLLTSIRLGEAAPVSVMEAMASGLPVIASIIGGTPDMIADGEDGFLCPQEDVEAIAGRLRQLAGDPGLRRRIGASARVTAERKFDARALAGLMLRQIRDSREITGA
jgi:colanic acid/amylovoran biosynthesis glycosyltransferase